MKTPSSDLHALVHSLSRREKGYFRRHSRLFDDAGDSLYMVLFDAIEQQDTYDEAAIVAAHPEIKANQIRNLKRYLYTLILTVLEKYHTRQNPTQQVWRDIRHIEILIRKRLLQQARKLHKKAKKAAEKYEIFSAHLELIHLERRLLEGQGSSGKLRTRYESLLDQEAVLMQKIEEIQSFRRMAMDVTVLGRKAAVLTRYADKQMLQRTMDKPEFWDDARWTTFRTRNSLYNHNAIAKQLANEESVHYVEKRVAHFEAHPHFVRMAPEVYLSALINLTAAYFRRGMYAELKDTAEKMPALRMPTRETDLQKMARYYGVMVSLAAGTQDLALLQRTAAAYRKNIAAYEDVSHPVAQAVMYMNVAEASMRFGAPEAARFWLNRILNDPGYFDSNFYPYFQVWSLLAHFESGNEQYAGYELRNLRNQFRGDDERTAFQAAVVRALGPVLKAPLAERRHAWQIMYADLKTAFERQPYPNNRDLLRYIRQKSGLSASGNP